MSEDKNIHQNHRQRVQQRVREHGFEGMADHEVLEYLLFFAIPRVDTNPIAHNLLNHFGSFSHVMEAEETEIAKVRGMGAASARLLHAILLAARHYQQDRRKEKPVMKHPEDFKEYSIPLFLGERNELVYAMILNDKFNLIRCVCLDDGSPNGVDIPVTKLVREVMTRGGTAVVLAHNHPSGMAIPSPQDVNATMRVVRLLGELGISVLDHIIVAGDEACSMLQRGKMPFYDPLTGKVDCPL